MAKNLDGGAVAGAVLAVIALVFVLNWMSMLVFGATAGLWDHVGPGYWQTFFSLWSIGILGASFHGTSIKKN